MSQIRQSEDWWHIGLSFELNIDTPASISQLSESSQVGHIDSWKMSEIETLEIEQQMKTLESWLDENVRAIAVWGW